MVVCILLPKHTQHIPLSLRTLFALVFGEVFQASLKVILRRTRHPLNQIRIGLVFAEGFQVLAILCHL